MLNAAKSECSSVESLADSERVCEGGGGGAEQRPRQAESEEFSCKLDGLLSGKYLAANCTLTTAPKTQPDI